MAAQPPRIPPNNLLFCGPPSSLPHVVLLPSDAPNVDSFYPPPETCTQTNDEDTLHEINNVGVPTYGGTFDGQVENNVLEIDKSDYDLPPDNYLRRTHSFDISDIYTSHLDSQIDSCALRHRRSEPDLSKYGLFVEAEVTVDCAPLEQPQLVLNNPFYDGSYALETSQLNQAMVLLPENYLAFEDAFVPSWNYKPDFVDGDFNAGLYYDGLPLIPSNDPWSAYANDNIEFQYYSPQYEAPITDQDDIHYIPLTDLDYAIPTYMSLPVVEEARIDNIETINLFQNTLVTNVDNNTHCSGNSSNIEKKTQSELAVALENNAVNNDVKASAVKSTTYKESSVQSEESVNADISNDVTSSLAFIPSSKSSQMPDGGDDTNDDTSPCSTDYHEASALDLVQNLDELSCCDSTDFSQSRDEISPIPVDVPKTKIENDSEVNIDNKTNTEKEAKDVVSKSSSNLPLSELPSIPIPECLPSVLPQVGHITNKKFKPVVNNEVQPTTSQVVDKTKSPVHPSDSGVKKDTFAIKTPRNVPLPPAVPPSWLKSKQSTCDKSSEPPKICIQEVGIQSETVMSVKAAPAALTIVNQHAPGEPQPSCSFAPAQPSQLKPEKQTKEVEVSQQTTYLLISKLPVQS